MQRFYFEYSSLLIIPCMLLAALVAWYLYSPNPPWDKRINRFLTGLRFTTVFILLMLLLGPVINLVLNQMDKPLLVLLLDHSRSVGLRDSTSVKEIPQKLKNLEQELESNGYNVEVRDLEGINDPKKFNGTSSDLSGALKQTELDFEDSNLTSVVLLSDGIFNNGVSPLYSTTSVPIHTIGIGDTIQQKDIRIKQLSYNKVVFQGNRFPVRAEIIASGMGNLSETIQITATSAGKTLDQKQILIGNQPYHIVDFMLEAKQPGLIRIDITAETIAGEFNRMNNRMSAIVEVVDSKKNILLVSSAPHPDIKALRSVIEKNENYSVSVHVPGVVDSDKIAGQSKKPDMIVFNQLPDQKNNGQSFLELAKTEKIPSIFIVGQQTAIRQLSKYGVPIDFEATNQWDEVNAIPSSGFRMFQVQEQNIDLLNRMPPLLTPFGKFSVPGDIQTLWLQRIGNVVTDRPLLFTMERDERRMAILLGEGIWRWKINEYQLTQKTILFDEAFSKLIQYISTSDDKRKFRCFPIERIFSASQPAILEIQIFDEVFQPQYGIPVQVEITNDRGEKQNLSFTPDPSKSRLTVSLTDGVYRYKASIERNGKKETDSGTFSISPGDAESQDLTADFQLLRRLSQNTGGQFFKVENWDDLKKWLTVNIPPSRMRSDQSFYPAIDLAWIFFLLLVLSGTEWVIRKRYG